MLFVCLQKCVHAPENCSSNSFKNFRKDFLCSIFDILTEELPDIWCMKPWHGGVAVSVTGTAMAWQVWRRRDGRCGVAGGFGTTPRYTVVGVGVAW